MSHRSAEPARRPADEPPRLAAELALPHGRLHVPRGAAVELPDDDAHVAALVGDDRDRTHRIVVDGRRLDRRSAAARVRAGLVAVGEAPVAAGVEVRDHLAAVVRRTAAVELLARTPSLATLARRPAGLLSGGERRLLAWTVARALRPAVVVLDRAGTGLDPDALRWADGVVAGWRAGGVGVLVRVGRPEERAWLSSPGEPPAGRPRAAGRA